eukprot:481972_1
MSFKHRKRLCELICASEKYNWIHPSHIQCAASIHYLQKYFLAKYPAALMINAMGADKILQGRKKIGKWRKYSTNINNRKCLTVCLKRKGYFDHAYNLYLKDVANGLVNPNAFLFIDGSVKEVSSTMIRNILKQYKQRNDQRNRKKCMVELSKLMNSECASYLLNNIDSIWYQNVGNKGKQIHNKRKDEKSHSFGLMWSMHAQIDSILVTCCFNLMMKYYSTV